MKKLNLNKKGFTLIELLAVIVILALLVAVAVPAVTRYLNTARAGVFANDAATAISAVRNEVMASNVLTSATSDSAMYIELNEINKLIESSKQMYKSSYGPYYTGSCNEGDYTNEKDCIAAGKKWTSNSYVKVNYDASEGTYSYCIYLTDGLHYIDQNEENVVSENVSTKESTSKECNNSGTNIKKYKVGNFGLEVDG